MYTTQHMIKRAKTATKINSAQSLSMICKLINNCPRLRNLFKSY